MKELIAITMTIFAIGLLTIYGLDVIFSNISQGFLPFNHMVRGLGLGVPALVFPLLSFFITKNLINTKLGILIIINGVLIIIGGIAVIVPDSTKTMKINTYVESMFLIAIGCLTIFAGTKKIRN
ncbi:MAG: hypothetical protein OXF77_01965 [Thaumarchaeota archaeon]|nr:hypothetical protein [Nitrososphaerota archaeon]